MLLLALVRTMVNSIFQQPRPFERTGYFLQHQELLDLPAVDGRGGVVDCRDRDVPGIQVPDQRDAGTFLHMFRAAVCVAYASNRGSFPVRTHYYC